MLKFFVYNPLFPKVPEGEDENAVYRDETNTGHETGNNSGR